MVVIDLRGSASRLRSRRDIPDLDGVIPAGRGESLAVGAERDGVHLTEVAAEAQDFPAGRRDPRP